MSKKTKYFLILSNILVLGCIAGTGIGLFAGEHSNPGVFFPSFAIAAISILMRAYFKNIAREEKYEAENTDYKLLEERILGLNEKYKDRR